MTQPHDEAAPLIAEVVESSMRGDADLPLRLRKCMHACQLLGLTQAREWFYHELSGYPTEADVPLHRKVQGVTRWHENGSMYDTLMGEIEAAVYHDADRRPEPVTLDVRAAIDGLLFLSRSGYLEPTGTSAERWSQRRRRTVELAEYRYFAPTAFETVLRSIEEMTFDWASQQHTILRYGHAISDAWASYRRAVDDALATANLAGHLDAIDVGLRSTSSEAWRAALLGCRNLVGDLSKYLWQVSGSTYDQLPGTRNGKLDVSKGNSLNRISAYLHQKGFTGTPGSLARVEIERLSASFKSLNDVLSSAKDQGLTYPAARSAILSTYFLVGELATRTDMVPVTETRSQGAP